MSRERVGPARWGLDVDSCACGRAACACRCMGNMSCVESRNETTIDTPMKADLRSVESTNDIKDPLDIAATVAAAIWMCR